MEMRRVPVLVLVLAMLLLLLVMWRRIEGIVRRVLVMRRRLVGPRRAGVGRSTSSRVGWPRMAGILMLPGPARGGRLIVSFYPWCLPMSALNANSWNCRPSRRKGGARHQGPAEGSPA